MSSSRSSRLSWLSCHHNPQLALQSLNHMCWCWHLLLLQPSNWAAVTLHIHGMQCENSSYDPDHLSSRSSQSTAGFLCLDTFFKGEAIAHHRATKTTPSERLTVLFFFFFLPLSCPSIAREKAKISFGDFGRHVFTLGNPTSVYQSFPAFPCSEGTDLHSQQGDVKQYSCDFPFIPFHI